MSIFAKHKEEDHETPSPAGAMARVPDNRSQTATNVPPPPVRPAPAAQNVGTTIGRAVSIKGEIHAKEDLLIDGQMEGSLDLGGNRLVIGPNGKVRADIKAREVDIQGSVTGNVDAAERITLRKNATMVGDLKMMGVVIEDGAYFKGSIDITRAQQTASAGAPTAAPATSATSR